jgi:aspartyl-tRNA(Asn)/glutamyl-tRNA(Gln) amidotransferase subunit A
MARTPADAALLLESVSGPDPGDPASEEAPAGEPSLEPAGDIDGLRIGVCPDLHLVRLATDVQAAFDSALRVAGELGASVVEVRLPEAELAYPAFGTIQRAEALFTHVRAGLFPARRDEYGDDVRARLEQATRVTLTDYLAASADRQRLRAGFARLFREVDLLLTPVSAGSPLPIGEERLVHDGHELEFRELVMSYTVPQDLTGLPACAVRAGFDALGIPVGVQLTGPRWGEGLVLRAAAALHAGSAELQARRPDLPAVLASA